MLNRDLLQGEDLLAETLLQRPLLPLALPLCEADVEFTNVKYIRDLFRVNTTSNADSG
jgi:hypothetical protein